MTFKPSFYLFFLSILYCVGNPLPIWPAPPTPGTLPEGKMVHGSLDTFKGEGVRVAWGILKNPQGKGPEMDRVVLRIQMDSKDWEAVRIEGIDPFSGSQGTLYSALFPSASLDISLPRSHFDSFPRTEIHFFRSYAELQEGKPQWILYFVGVPDTTPEFLSVDRLMNHLEKALSPTTPR